MRSYFHLANAHEVLLDEDGVEAADLQEAAAEALAALQELRADHPWASTEWKDWKLNIADGSGTVVLSISLDAIGW